LFLLIKIVIAFCATVLSFPNNLLNNKCVLKTLSSTIKKQKRIKKVPVKNLLIFVKDFEDFNLLMN
jgi:hypothetical protein